MNQIFINILDINLELYINNINLSFLDSIIFHELINIYKIKLIISKAMPLHALSNALMVNQLAY